MPICSKLIFRRLLIKLATECTFKSNSRCFKPVGGCTMGGPLSVTFSDIFYYRFVDDIFSRWKLGDNVLFDRLNNYHPKIKLTIEVNPSKFLDAKNTSVNGAYKFNVYQKKSKLPSP